MPQDFRALVIHEAEDGTFARDVTTRRIDDLPAGDVLIRVHYSSLNYKDALSATGNRGVTRAYPHTPGIDAAGVIEESTSARFQPGEEVIVTGYDLGMNTAGGFGEYIRVPADWPVALPNGLTLRESMAWGTAGFTAALCIDALQRHGVEPAQGEILVSGATGGVGSTAVGILSKLGHAVVAVTGKPNAHGWLRDLGATDFLSREEAIGESSRPLLKERWAGAVDTVGGDILATALRSTAYGGTVACCGLVASPELPTTVYPFILRAVNLIGIDSARAGRNVRERLWAKLAGEWKFDALDSLVMEVGLEEVNAEIGKILAGQQRGRVVVKLAQE